MSERWEEMEIALGIIFDKCENLLVAARMPVAASTHVIGLTHGLNEIMELARPFRATDDDEPDAPISCYPGPDEDIRE